ncbi:MAG: NAD(P)/FAD-dependent oxidoreductase [Vicinamibacterales bacterium]
MTCISRRTFLNTGVAAAVTPASSALAGTLTHSSGQAAPAIAAGLPDVVVVGAGAFGAWTALSLRERGAKVTLLDAYGPGHPRATSCDEVRQIRMSYGDREVYSRSAMNALELWKKREAEFGRKLLYPGGRLVMRRAWNTELEDQKAVFDRLSLPYEVLKPDEMAKRYPQVGFAGVGVGFLDVNAGLLKAREAIMAITEAFERKGGTIRLARAMPGAPAGRTLPNVTVDGGGTLSAGAFVFACGPWLRHVFPDLLGKVITSARIEIAYIGSPAGDPGYRQGVLPNLSEEGTFPGAPPNEVSYTQSDIDAGLKIARGGPRLPMDLDRDERIISARQISRIHEYVRVRFPRLKEPIVSSRVCQSDASPDSHFVLDRHPGHDNVWIAGGGSGHGFKHGPVVGEYMADRVTGRPAVPELEKSFSLAGRG